MKRTLEQDEIPFPKWTLHFNLSHHSSANSISGPLLETPVHECYFQTPESIFIDFVTLTPFETDDTFTIDDRLFADPSIHLAIVSQSTKFHYDHVNLPKIVVEFSLDRNAIDIILKKSDPKVVLMRIHLVPTDEAYGSRRATAIDVMRAFYTKEIQAELLLFSKRVGEDMAVWKRIKQAADDVDLIWAECANYQQLIEEAEKKLEETREVASAGSKRAMEMHDVFRNLRYPSSPERNPADYIS